MRIRVGDRREEHSEDHLVNRCGSYMPPPPPLPTYWPWTFLASNDPSAQRKSALWSNTHFSPFLNQALHRLWMALTDLHSTTSAFIWVLINENCITIIYHYRRLKQNTNRSRICIVFILIAELLHNSEKKSKAVLGVGLGALKPPIRSRSFSQKGNIALLM